MKSTKLMLTALFVLLVGIAFAQPGNDSLLFRSILLLPVETLTIVFPSISLLLILIGIIIGIIALRRKD